MIRIIVFLILIAALAFAGTWIADRPGEVVATWQGWRIETSVLVLAATAALLVLLGVLLWNLLRFVLGLPDFVAFLHRERRRARGWRAISNGLIAVGTGDRVRASRSALEARRFAGHEPLTLLLAAQAAQLEGKGDRAEAEFRAMLARPETRLLGWRGLYVEARRRNDALGARVLAEEVVREHPGLGWASEALLGFQCLAGDWSGALATVEGAARAGAIDKSTSRRRRAVLLTAQALALESSRPAEARPLALQAYKLAPELVPAAAAAGRLLAAAGNHRRAARILETAWKSGPHPELAAAYSDLRPGDAARDRLKRIKRLAAKSAGDPEAALAVARAAIDAEDFKQARAALAPHLAEPTQRVCLMMAELEAGELGDHGKAREWTVRAVRARRDPAWVADGYLSEQWLPASPLTGKIDAFRWLVPQEAIAGPVLERVTEAAIALPPAPVAGAPATAPATASNRDQALEFFRTARREQGHAPIVPEPPLPDDPGPEPVGARRRFRLFDWLAGPGP